MGGRVRRAHDTAPSSSLSKPVRSVSGGLGPCHLGVLVDGDRRAHRDSVLPDHPGAVRGIWSHRLPIVSVSARVVGKLAWSGGLLFHIVPTDY